MKYLLVLFSLFLVAFAQANSTVDCQQVRLLPITHSGTLAVVMGKLKIFDVKIMMRFEDDQIIKKGEILVATGNNFRPSVIIGRVKKDSIFEYQLPTGKTFEIDYQHLKSHNRSLAKQHSAWIIKSICSKRP